MLFLLSICSIMFLYVHYVPTLVVAGVIWSHTGDKNHEYCSGGAWWNSQLTPLWCHIRDVTTSKCLHVMRNKYTGTLHWSPSQVQRYSSIHTRTFISHVNITCRWWPVCIYTFVYLCTMRCYMQYWVYSTICNISRVHIQACLHHLGLLTFTGGLYTLETVHFLNT